VVGLTVEANRTWKTLRNEVETNRTCEKKERHAQMLIKKGSRWINDTGTQQTLLKSVNKDLYKISKQREPSGSVFLRLLPYGISPPFPLCLIILCSFTHPIVCDFHSLHNTKFSATMFSL
jgi:hypothetical protein